ncbi:hypothetical protein [Paenibacillus thalictri]|nr:hypothetical protein [Paenibacillus thalictri]
MQKVPAATGGGAVRVAAAAVPAAHKPITSGSKRKVVPILR